MREAAAMRVLVCGGRAYCRPDRVREVLDWLHRTSSVSGIIEGGATGADWYAAEWADANGVPTMTFHAQWKVHGRAAGPLRNQQMIDEGKPDLVLAFPGGKGTADMVKRAELAGLPVRVVT